MTAAITPEKDLVQVRQATVRFAGDSGDGMQLVGNQFADIASVVGNFICSLPDYPSEIRAPTGSLGGVSGYQLNFGADQVTTPGDAPFVLVAMNPAALKVNLPEVQQGGIVVVNSDEFTDVNLKKAEYDTNPLEDDSLSDYRVIPVPMTSLTKDAVKDSGLPRRFWVRCKNFFALGLMLWMYDRPLQPVLEWLMKKFHSKKEVMAANGASLRAGENFANTAELFRVYYRIAAAKLPAGEYRRVTGNEAIALGALVGSLRTQRRLVYASYPITPASEILHELSKHKEFDVRTIQAEDEIAACCAAIGASFAGAVGVTGTSGPGLALKTEAIGLAVIAELPLLVINVQRAGPSTGMPTKTEQADLLMAIDGRPGESPAVVMAANSPADCFDAAFDAVRLATKYMTPVILLSDSFLANSAEPMMVPNAADLPDLLVEPPSSPKGFAPYSRDEETLSRPWAAPGMAGFEHRVGGLEKQDRTGVVTYDAENHRKMVQLRGDKIARIAEDIPPANPSGPESGPLLVVGWGSTYGAIAGAVGEMQREGFEVAHLHLRHLNPMPANTEDVLRRYDRVLAPENNLGHLKSLIQRKFALKVDGLSKVEGRPFLIRDIRQAIEEILDRA